MLPKQAGQGLDLLPRVWPQVIQQAQPLRRSLRLVSKYASLRLASGAHLLACLTCLRLASGPAQPATRHPASGPICMKQALPIQQPAQAQLSPARPAQVPGATSSVVRLPGNQQPTHGFAASWLRLGFCCGSPPEGPKDVCLAESLLK